MPDPRALALPLCAFAIGCGAPQTDAFEISSDIVGDTFRLQAWAPDELTAETPLVILLDGDFWFRRVAPLHARLPDTSAAVLVGVGYANGNERDRDLLPASEGGDIDAFFQFIEQELFPELFARYNLDDNRDRRCLYGHSNGGFAALWATLERPELFAGVVAASPNLSTGDGLVFELLDQPAPSADVTTLRTAVGSLETPASITAPHALLTERLADEARPSVLHDGRVFTGLSHSRVVGPTYRWAVPDCVGGAQ